MAVATGQRHSAGIAASQRVVDLHREILLLEPDAAPFTTITKQYGEGVAREQAEDPKYTWHNDALETRFDAVNNGAGYASSATSIVVDTGTAFAVDDLVKVPRTGELMLVTAISTNTLTVIRGVGGSTAAALVDNDPLYILGTSAVEGSLSQGARSENPTLVTNYTQIFKQSVEASGTVQSSSNESTPHDYVHQSKKQMLEHMKDIELAGLFGGPGENDVSGKKQRTTGGLQYFLTSNNQNASGAWTIDEVNTFIRTLTRYGSASKTLFCSRLVAAVFDTHSLGKMQTHVGDDTFGVHIGMWQTNLGELKIISHPLIEGATYDGYGFAVDFKVQAVGYRYLAGDGPGGGRDTHVKRNIQEPDRDGQKDEILTECGFRVGLPQTGGVVYGVTGAS
jgi:Family of unknown function (DUF5309)